MLLHTSARANEVSSPRRWHAMAIFCYCDTRFSTDVPPHLQLVVQNIVYQCFPTFLQHTAHEFDAVNILSPMLRIKKVYCRIIKRKAGILYI